MCTLDARIYRIRAEYRRCGIYVWVGSILCLLLAIVIAPIVQQGQGQRRSPAEMISIMALAVLAATLFCIAIWQWRLRIDHEGIARWWLWRWYLWPWEAFRSGSIREGNPERCYVWPEASITWRTLTLDMIEDSDARQIDSLVKTFCAESPEIELPDDISFRLFLTKVRLLPDGLEICRGRTERRYFWKDINRVVITRWQHSRRGFTRLRIEIGDRPIELCFNKGSPTWQGAPAEVIGRWFTTHAPADRVLNVALKESPRSEVEARYRLAATEKRHRDVRMVSRGLFAFLAGVLLLGFALPKLFLAMAFYSPVFVINGYVFYGEFQRLRKEREMLVAWLESTEE